MSDLISKIKSYVDEIKNGAENDIVLMVLSFVVMAITNVLGMGIIFSVITTLVIGIVWELLCCYAPKTTINILKWSVVVPDIKTFVSNLKSFVLTKYNDFNKGYILFNAAGIIAYMVLKVIVIIIF